MSGCASGWDAGSCGGDTNGGGLFVFSTNYTNIHELLIRKSTDEHGFTRMGPASWQEGERGELRSPVVSSQL